MTSPDTPPARLVTPPLARRIKGTLKIVVLKAGGRRLYAKAVPFYVWGRTLLNYFLIRLTGALGLPRASAWPHALFLETSNICNARCVFCAYPKMRRPKMTMSMELFRSVIDQYALTGGEVDLTPIVGDPFMDLKFFERLDYISSKPSLPRFHFFTNAIAMTPEVGARLLKYAGRLTVNISFGGFDAVTYNKVFGVDKFEAATANIRSLIELKRAAGSALGIQINLRTPLENNKGPFWDYLMQAETSGLAVITWMGAYDSWAGQVEEEALKEAGLKARPMPDKYGPCHRLLTSPVVLADGLVNACACRDVEGTLIIGDLRQQPLKEVLRGKPLYDLLKRHAAGDFPEVCRKCTYYDPVYPGWLSGKANRKDPSVQVEAGGGAGR
jgi:MoaA/NifB/PqqE/SkfB family radical SAM enzyme